MQQDTSQRFLCDAHHWRGEIVRLNECFRTIMLQHGYPVPIQELLGEALLAATLMTSSMKFAGQLTLQFQSEGPLELMVVKCDHELRIRGMAQWQLEASMDELRQALLQGQLIMTLQQDQQRQPYQSIVPVEQDDITAALARYYRKSEQIATLFKLAVDQQQAIGIMLQLLPDNAESAEGQLPWVELQKKLMALPKEQLLQQDNVELIRQLEQAHDVQLYEPRAVQFFCPCDVARMQGALIAMGKEQVFEILAENQVVDVTCEYCNHSYAFSYDEIQEIFANSP